MALETTDIDTESAKWHDLCSKECQLFNLLRQMDWEENNQYRILILGHLKKINEMYADTDPDLVDWTMQIK